jgi:lipopolysaccharide transport system ATP-binding protein
MTCLRVEKLGKRYKHYARPLDRLWDWASVGWLRRYDERWVLRGVSFEVQPGQAVGVVGANGAGKSTLLKLIRGTVRPTEGQVQHQGRMAALELGLGFHPDFTGRQNLYTAGALLGLSGARVRELEPEI